MSPDLRIIKEFCEALKIAAEQGFSKLGVLTHAWHESGAFRRVIGNHGYWGIKKPKNWQGKTVLVDTHEYIDGERVPLKAPFIDFDSANDAIIWYCSFIRRLYPEAYYKRDNPMEYFIGLISGSLQYASDPTYSVKLTSLYRILKDDINIKFLIDEA
jgi:flagellum-specific peptidoglycan hydrolase FlgJ